MKVRLLTVSHKQPAWVLDACADYQRRLPREWAFQLVEIKPSTRTSGVAAERVQADEALRLRAAVPPRARLVALDERGEAWTTLQLAERLGRWQQEARDLCLIVGGADGLAPDLKAAAEHRMALSAFTLPHGLVRVVLVEQLYRAASVLAGHPYHRA